MNRTVYGEHEYKNITLENVNAIKNALKEKGADITGENPWNADMNNHDIVLRGAWNEGASILFVFIINKNWYTPCSIIWDTIDPIIENISESKSVEYA